MSSQNLLHIRSQQGPVVFDVAALHADFLAGPDAADYESLTIPQTGTSPVPMPLFAADNGLLVLYNSDIDAYTDHAALWGVGTGDWLDLFASYLSSGSIVFEQKIDGCFDDEYHIVEPGQRFDGEIRIVKKNGGSFLQSGPQPAPGPQPVSGAQPVPGGQLNGAAAADPLRDLVMRIPRPLDLPPPTPERAAYYWTGASEAELRQFLNDHLNTQVTDYTKRRFFAARYLVFGA